MYEHIHEAPDLFSLTPHEEGISNRARRAMRPQTSRQRLQQARRSQSECGMRLRIWRKVLNEDAFDRQMKVWHAPQQGKTAERTNKRTFSLTVFDTQQQPLENMERFDQDELAEILQRRFPTMFERVGKVAVAGTARFGSPKKRFVALSFRSHQIEAEQRDILQVVAPELWLSDSHQKIHRPHVSLGKITVADAAECDMITGEMESLLAPVIPRYVDFGPMVVDLTHE